MQVILRHATNVTMASEKVDVEMTRLNKTMASLVRSNNNMENLLLETMLLDIRTKIRTHFGTIKQNKNIYKDKSIKVLREGPKNLEGIWLRDSLWAKDIIWRICKSY